MGRTIRSVGRFRHLLLFGCLFAFSSRDTLVHCKKRKRNTLDEASDSCKACKRIVLNIESAILPEIRKAKLHENKKRNLDLGGVEEQILDKTSHMCTYSNVYYHKEIRKECERIMDEFEQDIARTIVAWGKAAGELNLVRALCHEMAAACPSSANSTQSELVPRKDKYRSERPPSSQAGPLLKIVASTWIELVTNTAKDILTFNYDAADLVHIKLTPTLRAVASRLQPCTTIGIGTIDMSQNDIPPPYGEYAACPRGRNTWRHLHGSLLAIWRADDKMRPAWQTLLKDLKGGELSQFDVLDFIYKSVSLKESFRCMAELSNDVAEDKDELQRLQATDASQEL